MRKYIELEQEEGIATKVTLQGLKTLALLFFGMAGTSQDIPSIAAEESQDERKNSARLASIFFDGSISDSISLVQAERKLLAVYIGGNDEASQKLEKITLQHGEVLKQLTERFVILHLLEGSQDAANFNAIYSFRSVPTITIVGYNGLLLERFEGYVTPEELLTGLQKTEATFHLQNASANTIMAALASSRFQPNNITQASEASTSVEGSQDSQPESVHPPVSCNTFSGLEVTAEQSSPNFGSNESESTQSPPNQESQSVSSDSTPLGIPEQSVVEQTKDADVIELCSVGASPISVNSQVSESKSLTKEKFPEEAPSHVQKQVQQSKKATPGHVSLQFRLTNGKNMCGEFEENDSLGFVKAYIDRNRTDGDIGYVLAMPYPRKTFGETDMAKTLLELQLTARASLILVPNEFGANQRPSAVQMRSSNAVSTSSETGVSGNDDSFLWRVLSYLNPFSYFGGAPSNEVSTSPRWEYAPNPALGRALRDSRHPQNSSPRSSNRNTSASGQVAGSSSKSAREGWGANIHTLRNDEDEMPRRGNSYWNGNSTEFGGDESKRD